ncbi:MAG: helix-turn-helix domain-containing protein [Treponema sp.]|nr:helix-turn-helix domain-containing protein [Treponema sp.]
MKLKDVFIQNLRKSRKSRKMSQMILAEMCNTSTSYIGQIEIGNRFPSLELIEKIALALEIEPYLLFMEETDSKAPTELLQNKTGKIPLSVKKELINNLSTAIRKVVNQIS